MSKTPQKILFLVALNRAAAFLLVPATLVLAILPAFTGVWGSVLAFIPFVAILGTFWVTQRKLRAV